jgi:NAD(P)-dependent dehydrogenase (short-subunit alcohol dehydrogenase family)
VFSSPRAFNKDDAMSAQHKVAFVTGASSGIGRATAHAFIAQGYATALVDRDEKSGTLLQKALAESGECTFIACDVSNDASVQSAVEHTIATFGRLDVAFNAAGIGGEAAPTADCTVENWNRVIAIDLTGVWLCMRHQLRQMLKQGGGAIVNCSSSAGLRGSPNLPAYVAAKHGVVGLTKAAALEYAKQGIRVNAICPGIIDTPLMRTGIPAERLAILLAHDVIGRVGAPEEVAALALWLCSEHSSFVNGQAIAVDGGRTAR